MKYILIVLTTAVIVFLAATIYYKGLPSFPSFSRNLISTQSGVPVTSTESLPETKTNAEMIQEAVYDAFIIKYGTEASDMVISVTEVNGAFAKGLANQQGGGGMWFGAKAAGKWELVWAGNGIIKCSDLSAYPNYPATLIPECWDDATDKLIKR